MQLEIVAFLATRERFAEFDELVEAVWRGSVATTSARAALRRLRNKLGSTEAGVPRLGGGLVLAVYGISCDWSEFVKLTGSRITATSTLDLCRALNLVTGTPFDGVEGGTFEWAFDPNNHLVASMEHAIEAASAELAGRMLKVDRDRAVWAADQGLLANPTSEMLTALKLAAQSHSCALIRRTWHEHLELIRALGDFSPSPWLVECYDRLSQAERS